MGKLRDFAGYFNPDNYEWPPGPSLKPPRWKGRPSVAAADRDSSKPPRESLEYGESGQVIKREEAGHTLYEKDPKDPEETSASDRV